MTGNYCITVRDIAFKNVTADFTCNIGRAKDLIIVDDFTVLTADDNIVAVTGGNGIVTAMIWFG